MGNAAVREISGTGAFIPYSKRGKADAGNGGKAEAGGLKIGSAGFMSSGSQNYKNAGREIPAAWPVHRNENPGEQAAIHSPEELLALLARLEAEGYFCTVCYSMEAAKNIILKYVRSGKLESTFVEE